MTRKFRQRICESWIMDRREEKSRKILKEERIMFKDSSELNLKQKSRQVLNQQKSISPQCKLLAFVIRLIMMAS
ncbi:hypothetical protein FRX31_016689 [Thalictrum thalictroides]|uniref:Uncharacterized protein n=1 Tax=Thalictrum thalictroides TaxID=46969 RepID=A0A7J6W9W0_THATH|nr:hypothetical protein FRX31_016689 [Thalictrum thalictroides]